MQYIYSTQNATCQLEREKVCYYQHFQWKLVNSQCGTIASRYVVMLYGQIWAYNGNATLSIDVEALNT